MTRQPPAGDAAPPRTRMRLRLPPAYDLDWVLGFLADRAAPSLERVDAAGLVRVVRIDDTPVVLSVRLSGGERASPPRHPASGPAAQRGPGPAAQRGPASTARRWLAVETVPASVAQASVRHLVRRMLDLDVDLGPFLELARRDPVLAPLVARHPGLRLPQLPDGFEGLVRAIVGQQVSVAAARTVVDRLVHQLGDPAGAGLFAFPRPAAVAATPLDRLTALGLTRAKAAALTAAATATRDGALDWERLRVCPPEVAHAALLALPGIGPWTAAYVRMRALGDRDAFPTADLGILKALAARGLGMARPNLAAARPNHAAARPNLAAIDALAEGWRPYRAYAAIHLWRSLSG
jgi:3-methyladenine DNA glycosylase/8-oxoguanine DNA glycosylase